MSDWVRKVRDEMTATQAEHERKRVENGYRIYRIPRGLWDVTMSYIPEGSEYREKLIAWHGKYLSHVRDDLPFPGLFLHGAAGSGKSAIAAGILKWAFAKGVGGMWLGYNEIVGASKTDPPWVEGVDEGMWSYAHRAKLLVVDDILRGGKDNTYNHYQVTLFEQLLRDRWSEGLTTVITCNYSPKEIEKIDLHALVGVIDESCYSLHIDGADFRGYLANKKEPLL